MSSSILPPSTKLEGLAMKVYGRHHATPLADGKTLLAHRTYAILEM